VVLLERAEDPEVEDRAEVYVEAFLALAGEDLAAVAAGGEAVYRGRAEGVVVGGRQLADVARRFLFLHWALYNNH